MYRNAFQLPKSVGDYSACFAAVDNKTVLLVRRPLGSHVEEVVPVEEIRPTIEALPDSDPDKQFLLTLEPPSDMVTHQRMAEAVGIYHPRCSVVGKSGVLAELADYSPL